MKILFMASLCFLLSATGVQAGHHEQGETTASAVIGTSFTPDGTAKEVVVGSLSHQQMWVDYIQAHNDRDLKKIAEINAEDWVGYPPDGSVIEGNAAHIEWLDEWFKSSDDPKWTVRWMIANSEKNDEGEVEHWLTTGNDITFNDADGNQVTEHHMHNIQFADGRITQIYVYSRPAPNT